MISGFFEAAEFLVIPQLGELLLDGLAPRELRQVGNVSSFSWATHFSVDGASAFSNPRYGSAILTP
jgi:hypothetical protein